jgi:hypothetical protein
MKTAGRWQERGHGPLIETQGGDYRFPHCVMSRSTSRRSSSGDAVKAARRGLMTMSHSGAKSRKRIRKVSRNRLFTLFRLTAFPKARGTVNPSLGPSPPTRGTLRQKAAKYWPAIRIPSWYALRNSEAFRIRALFGKPRLVGVPNGSLVANREFMAAFGAAPRQDGPPVFGAHTHPKPVGLGPFPIVWLKCPFWHCDPRPGR